MDENRNSGSFLLLFLKNPYVLIAALIVFVVASVLCIMFFAGGSSQDGFSDNAMENFYVKCTEGELNEDIYSKAFEKAGAFTDMGQAFRTIGSRNDVDPVLLAAIAFHETGYGKSNLVVNKNNPGGLYNSSAGGFYEFGSLEEGLDAMAANLNKLYISKGLITIVQIGNKYAPIGVDNDPNNLNAHWIPTVSNIVNDLGGLSMNCQAVNMGSGEFVKPIPNVTINSNYGTRIDPIDGTVSNHRGVDLACKSGDPIYSASGGKIAVAKHSGYNGGFGNHVVINHGDKFTLYAHMTTVYVDQGQTVEQGQPIGSCGTTGYSTGPHLHFEVQLSLYGERVNPMQFFGK
jgi:murein DD-endopeptidase MepM/ murein hydrolase activator NlpD